MRNLRLISTITEHYSLGANHALFSSQIAYNRMHKIYYVKLGAKSPDFMRGAASWRYPFFGVCLLRHMAVWQQQQERSSSAAWGSGAASASEPVRKNAQAGRGGGVCPGLRRGDSLTFIDPPQNYEISEKEFFPKNITKKSKKGVSREDSRD